MHESSIHKGRHSLRVKIFGCGPGKPEAYRKVLRQSRGLT